MHEPDINIEFHGPFKLSANDDVSLFQNELSHLAGIYLLASQYDDGYLVYYIGETGQSFHTRLKDHVIQFFGGNYRIWKPEKFKKGEKEIFWNGMWKKGTRSRVPEFIDRSVELVSTIKQFVQLVGVILTHSLKSLQSVNDPPGAFNSK